MSDDDKVPAVRSATAEVLFWSAMKDAVTRRYDKARAVVAEEMRRAGSEKQRGWDEAGMELGTVTLGEDTEEAEIFDEGAFIDWVVDQYPTEYYQTAPKIAVHPAFRAKVLADPEGRFNAWDGPPPGVRVVPKQGQVRVLANGAAKERAAEFTRSGLKAVAPPPE